jgi:predicted nucleic acid-binding protein
LPFLFRRRLARDSRSSSRPDAHGSVGVTCGTSARRFRGAAERRVRARRWSGSALMSADVWYVDSSALVKTVIQEPESKALLKWLGEKEKLAACDLVRVEVVRAVRLSCPDAVARARSVVATLTLIRVDDAVYEAAADLEPQALRSLDAIHLSAALSLGPDLAGVVTYDERMSEGARALGLTVEAPLGGREPPASGPSGTRSTRR